ncbi:MAG: NADPH:quinone oxidoreductase family protein [Porticoccaceae bacterium]
MRAMVCREFGSLENLKVENVSTPEVGVGTVLVEIHSIGVNFTDILAVSGRSQLKRQFPFTPGVEAAGIVIAVGEGVTKIRLGQRVLGSKPQGTYAEEVIFLEDEIFPIPDSMDMQTASTFYVVALTADYAISDRAKLLANETMLVLAAGGGAGLAAVEVGKAIGAKVVAAASSREKLDLAISRGADAAVLYPSEKLDIESQKNLMRELIDCSVGDNGYVPSIGEINSVHDNAGYNVVFDGVGGTYAEPALRALAWHGRYLSIGFAAGVPRVSLAPVLFKDGDIMGIQPVDDQVRLPGRNPKRMEKLFGWFDQGFLRPQITATYRMEDAAKVLSMMSERKVKGRVVLITERSKM